MFSKKARVNLFGAPNQILKVIYVICDSWGVSFCDIFGKG